MKRIHGGGVSGCGDHACAGWRLPSGASNYRVKTMRTDLDHLPANKQRELERVKQIIFEAFADSIALATMIWKKKGRNDKNILYGSYARGGWDDEPSSDERREGRSCVNNCRVRGTRNH